MGNLSAIFWKGVATLLPLTVTVYALYWAVVSVEHLLRPLVPDSWYFPGSGLLLAIAFIGLFGALMHFFLFEWLVGLGSSLLNRIPVVKSIYSALQDFFSYLGHRSTDSMSRVVLVTLREDCRLVGFVTNPRFTLPSRRKTTTRGSADEPQPGADPVATTAGDGAAGSELVSVYLPMSYQVGGFMVLLPGHCLEPLDMSAEEAMRLVLTAGVRSAGEQGPGGGQISRNPAS